ncbi:hypothetical protein J4E86_001167 [Alternaria arbusti]|uniref:uncharacterized protein n=1 Tax=Alternaria arbusti TaxID=232088 RepID=UPI00221EA791|nr:uncharacterized protein J4E86_001167 [Alternaria arbusti]KAI4962135.1 hypothetical protein J4E86_001167 [Alternaria arbusti]
MDVDWTVPIHPDHSEQGMSQDTTYDTFLEEQGAMDATLWGDVPMLSIEPRPDSEDTTGLEAESIMDWGCLCDFPPLYCQQHGVYGNFSVDNDLPLPSFGPEQTTTYPDDVMESLELAPGRLELTEANRNDHFLSPSPFEMGHARPNLPSNDQTHSYTANHSRDPIKPLVKQASRRSDISSKNRTILSACFLKNRYPDTREMNELQKRTSLDKKCVKTWFSNARQRTARLPIWKP